MSWKPNAGPQERFLSTPAHEALYGGAAGGGKSDALLAETLRQVTNSPYRAVILRRTFPELEQSGGLIDRSKDLYPLLNGVYSAVQHRWSFPSGALIDFGHMQREDDKRKYQGAQYALVAFDELTHFTETQYLYLFSRCRAPADSNLRCYVRAATNPGGPGHEWVKRRWGAWLDRQHPKPARAGELRYYARIDGQDVEVERNHPEARSRTFIPAFVADNPYLAGTDYERNLQLLPLVERKRLLEGDWDIMPGAGLVFHREWFEIVGAAPIEAQKVRFWDLAATEKEATSGDPDYTVGAKWVRAGAGLYFIEHIARVRGRWQGIKALIKQTAEADGPAVQIGVEQEPGASGKALLAEIVQHLAGFTVHGYPTRGDKLTRANPWAAQAEAGNVKLVNGPWVEAFLDECEWFPEGGHDDQVDACSGAFGMLTDAGWTGWWTGRTTDEQKAFVDQAGEEHKPAPPPPLRHRITVVRRGKENE